MRWTSLANMQTNHPILLFCSPFYGPQMHKWLNELSILQHALTVPSLAHAFLPQLLHIILISCSMTPFLKTGFNGTHSYPLLQLIHSKLLSLKNTIKQFLSSWPFITMVLCSHFPGSATLLLCCCYCYFPLYPHFHSTCLLHFLLRKVYL